MMKQTAIVTLCIFMTTLVVLAISKVGESTVCGTFTWGLPIKVFYVLVIPAILGFLIGAEE